MSKRIVVVALGLIIGYFAIYFGDGMYASITAYWQTTNKENADILVCILIGIGIAAFAIIGAIAWAAAIIFSGVYHDMDIIRDDESASLAALSLVCLAIVFGFWATPFTYYDLYPWSWSSKWDVLLLVALVPTALVIHGAILDIIEAQPDKEPAASTVTPIRRDSA